MATVYLKGRNWRAQTCIRGKRSSKVFPTEAQARAWAARMEGGQASMPEIRAAFADHRLAAIIPLRLREAAEKANHTPADVLGSALYIGDGVGVYFLVLDHRIAYIGQTVDVLARIRKHRTEGKRFDSFAFIPCAKEVLDELELTYITLMLPEQNRRLG